MACHHSVRDQCFSFIASFQYDVIVFNDKYEDKMLAFSRSVRSLNAPWERRSVAEVYDSVNPTYFLCAYHMSLESFHQLHFILLSHIIVAIDEWRTNYEKLGGRTGGKYLPPPMPNGQIYYSVCLAHVMQYFTGGSPYNIGVMIGNSYGAFLCV